MSRFHSHCTPLRALALAALLGAAVSGPAAAQTSQNATEADKELAQARAQLQEAARHLAELERARHIDARQRQFVEMRGIAPERPIIGIIMAHSDKEGVLIAGTTPSGPAAQAGIKAGDILIEANGRKIEGKDADARVQAAREAIGELREGGKVKLVWLRDGKRHEATVEARTMPGVMLWHGDGQALVPHGGHGRFRGIIDPEIEMEIARIAPFAGCDDGSDDCAISRLRQAMRWSGLRLAEINTGLAHYFGVDKGVLVLRDGEEDLAALKAGDVIVRVGDTEVDEPRAAMRALRAHEPGSSLTLRIVRERKTQNVQVTVPAMRRIEWFAPPAPPAAPAPPTPPAPPPPPKKPGAAPLPV